MNAPVRIIASVLGLFCAGEVSFSQIAPHVVISEVYGGGGNQGAIYQNDFVELYNPTNTARSLNGWSLQYASATGSGSWHVVHLKGEIPAYGFYLIKLAGGTNGDPLPPPDTTGTINLSSTSGKLALVRSTVALAGANPGASQIVDKVGYGSADGYEGSGPAPGLGVTISIERKACSTATSSSMAAGGADELSGNGWDSDDNALDFVAQKRMSPQNSASAIERPPDDLFPATLGSFTASPSGQLVLLNWSTLSERGSSEFEVQKSLSADEFSSISDPIPGHGSSGEIHEYSFTDTTRIQGESYRLKEIDTSGRAYYSWAIDAPIVVAVHAGTTNAFSTLQNYPNPFGPGTAISYRLTSSSVVRLAIYDILGREVKLLVDGVQSPGSYSVTWNPLMAAPGVYFCRLRTENSTVTTRLVRIR